MVFHWWLSDSKSPHVSRTLLSILAVFNNAVVWMVSTRPLTSNSSRPFNNPLVTVPKALITIGIIVTFIFHSFFNSLARSRYLSLFSHSFSFILWSAGTVKSIILQIFFFLLIIIRSGLLAEIRWSVCISKSHRTVCVIFLDRCWVVHIPFVGMVKFKFLAHFPVDHLSLPVMSSLVLLLCQFIIIIIITSNGELIGNVLQWTPSHGRAGVGHPTWTYLQQLCKDTGCCLENLLNAMDDRNEWSGRVKEIHSRATTRWLWLLLRIFGLLTSTLLL